jgi:hypothetical protein
MLLESNEPAQALKEFETASVKEPNRFHGLYGVARAAELLMDYQKARAFYEKLVAVCANADTERPELGKAKAFLTKR